MAVNKIEIINNGVPYTPIDLTDTTAVESNVEQGKVFYKASGVRSVGTSASVTPVGNINITDTQVTNVSQYETAQVVDANLIPENIVEDVTILGVTGTASGGSMSIENFTYGGELNIVNTIGAIEFNKQSTSLDFTGIDTSNIAKVFGMFNSCQNLESLNLSNFVTSNITDVSDIFVYCTHLTNLNVSNWETSNVTNFGAMCTSCGSLVSLDLSSFSTSNAVNMYGMFNGCSSLTTLTLGTGFITINANNIENMFAICYNLTTINYAGTTTQFNTNCANMIQELAYTIDINQTVTVHCSDGDITIIHQEKPLTVSVVGHIEGTGTDWDTDLDFTDNGNNNFTYSNLNLVTDDIFMLRFKHSWDSVLGPDGDITYTGFPNNNDYTAYITSEYNYFKAIQNCVVNIEVQIVDIYDLSASAVTITYIGV